MVDDASFTTLIKVHSGPTVTTRYRLVALLDSSPQTFITAQAWLYENQRRSDGHLRTPCAPRSWGGFGENVPLLTSTSVRLSVQFLHGDISSVEVAV